MSHDTKTPLTKSNFLVEAYFGKKKKVPQFGTVTGLVLPSNTSFTY